MKIEITFSLRDWRKGIDLLFNLGIICDLLATDHLKIEIEDEEALEELKEAIEAGNIEAEIKIL